MAKLTKQDVLYLAKLARLTLSEQEISQFVDEISTILTHVEQLESVSVANEQPTAQVTGLRNVTRPDELQSLPYTKTDLLQNVPRVTDDDYIQVKRVLS